MLISELTGNIWRGHTVWFDKYWPNRPLLPVVYPTLLIKFYKLGSIMTRNANSATQKLRKKFSQNGVSLKETKWRKKYEGNADSCVDWLHAFQMNQLCSCITSIASAIVCHSFLRKNLNQKRIALSITLHHTYFQTCWFFIFQSKVF